MTIAHISQSSRGGITSTPYTNRQIGLFIGLWFTAALALSLSRVFLALPLPVFGSTVSALLVGLVGFYVLSPRMRATARAIGLRRLTALHVWRIPAAIAFFISGAAGTLPETFVRNAGWGDLIAGILALVVVVAYWKSRRAYVAFHSIGFADFVLAVGTGLTFSILSVEGMETIAVFPMALIPLFGVTLSGLTHVMAFDLLLESRRDR